MIPTDAVGVTSVDDTSFVDSGVIGMLVDIDPAEVEVLEPVSPTGLDSLTTSMVIDTDRVVGNIASDPDVDESIRGESITDSEKKHTNDMIRGFLRQAWPYKSGSSLKHLIIYLIIYPSTGNKTHIYQLQPLPMQMSQLVNIAALPSKISEE